MQYDHILIRYGEISLKGKNIKMFINKLLENIKKQLKDFPDVKVKRTQGRMFVLLNGQEPEPVVERLKNIFGIHSLSLAIKVNSNINEIKEAALYALQKEEDVKTFKITAKRIDKNFPIRSMDLNKELGGHLLRNTEGITVDVHDPDVEIRVEIRNDATYITSSTVYGLGGLPVGTAGKSLLMLSGGIDSPVAGYLAMKRGIQLEAIHFHSPPYTSERAKQKVLDLTKQLTKYGSSIRVHIVPFTKLQQEIFREMPHSYAMTIMRRMMFRISEMVCKKEGILSIATGESLGQVASQTMESMHTINEVTNYPIIRPLVSMDKQEVVEISKKIGTYETSILPYEDCCTIFVPKSPKTRPRRDRVHALEATYDFSASIQEAVNDIELITIDSENQIDQTFDNLL